MRSPAIRAGCASPSGSATGGCSTRSPQQRDILPGLHANTQIPKLIGLARLYELTGDERHARAARFFRDTVARHHSYVIGGNSEREHFGPPDTFASRLNDRTCEACNSYNMLKLTRHVYGWAPDAALFDYYERMHLNHILAHQHPDTGMFAYFMPLAAGARRTWSTPDDSFWCCVGSGMESHAKHGDSIYWQDEATLYVNLFIPSALDWRGLKLELDTRLSVRRDGDADDCRGVRRAGRHRAAPAGLVRRAGGPPERQPRSRSSGATAMPCSAGAGAAATGSS